MPMITGQEANVTGDAKKGNYLALLYNEVRPFSSFPGYCHVEANKVYSTSSTMSRRSRLE